MTCPFGRIISEDANPTQEGNQSTEFGVFDYNVYMQIDKITNLQRLLSELHNDPSHDEHLFIIVHQVYELWFKQIIREIDSIMNIFNGEVEKEIWKIINRMQRINLILKLCIDQFSILETMTPLDFANFRDYVMKGSGFESYQFRMLENKIGIKSEQRVRYNRQQYLSKINKTKEIYDKVVTSENQPSLLQLVEKWLERTPSLKVDGFNFWNNYQKAVSELLSSLFAKAEAESDEKLRERAKLNVKQRMEHFDSIFDKGIHNSLIARGERRLSHKALQGALMITFYRDEPRFSQPQQLLTLLTEMDSLLAKWRYSHVMLVHKMIGPVLGEPGASSGYQYLRATLSDRYKVFLDLYNVSTYLIPSKYMPPLTGMNDIDSFSKMTDHTNVSASRSSCSQRKVDVAKSQMSSFRPYIHPQDGLKWPGQYNAQKGH